MQVCASLLAKGALAQIRPQMFLNMLSKAPTAKDIIINAHSSIQKCINQVHMNICTSGAILGIFVRKRCTRVNFRTNCYKDVIQNPNRIL